MKVYSVKPGSPIISVSDGRRLAADAPIAWGDASWGAACLCRAILNDVLGDPKEAALLAQRMKYRTVYKWPKESPNAITEDEVRAVAKDIRQTERDSAPMVQRMMREKPMFVTDRPGPGQQFSSNPDLTPNEPKETDK